MTHYQKSLILNPSFFVI